MNASTTGSPQANDEGGVVPTPAWRRQRRARSIAIAVALAALAVLFYLVTIIKLGPGILDRPL